MQDRGQEREVLAGAWDLGWVVWVVWTGGEKELGMEKKCLCNKSLGYIGSVGSPVFCST